MKKSFTMMEIIFVIVVLGILAVVALPRVFSGVSSAEISRVKSDLTTIRDAILNKYNSNVLTGNDSCPSLEKDTNDNYLFENVLSYPIKKNATPKWDGDGVDYNVTLSDKNVIKFKYDNTSSSGCLFKCVSNCDKIGE
jgi:general secretion pathway protein G